MKKIMLLFWVFVSVSTFAQKVDFDKYFVNQTLRFDYIHAGNHDTAFVFFDQLKKEPFWGGSHVNLIDTFGFGEYRVLVFDKASNKLIYSRGYSSLFYEWQATEEAKITWRSFFESVLIPYPKADIKIVIQERDKKNNFYDVFTYNVTPSSIFIKQGLEYNFKTYDLINSGDPAKKVDIVFLAEGYTLKEEKKFKADVQKFVDFLFKYEPFASHKSDFNIHVVLSFSAQSGTDIPGDMVWKNTILSSSFYTFGTERYLTTENFKTVRDVAAAVPYDQIYIITNTEKYGGGGVYNFFSLCVSSHYYAPQVFVHEFGHAFGGLADEYWTSDVAVEDYYDLTIEPSDPNITTMVDFGKKWKKFISAETPIPTPATKDYATTVGVFEGGGYVAKGVFRPQQNCMMKELDFPFCIVCQDAIEKMIKFYTE